MSKESPFFVIEDLLSPLQCERLLKMNFVQNAGKCTRGLNQGNIPIVSHALSDYTEQINQRYNAELSEDMKLLFQQYPEDATNPAQFPLIDGWEVSRRKWSKVKNIDLIGFIPLKSYCDSIPIDLSFEVYGGKLELMNFNFSILPERGSLILMPCVPNFVYAISPINFGTFEMIRVNYTFKSEWNFDIGMYSTKINDII